MSDPDRKHESDQPPVRAPLPEGEKLFDPWEEEFRKSYRNNDKTFEF